MAESEKQKKAKAKKDREVKQAIHAIGRQARARRDGNLAKKPRRSN